MIRYYAASLLVLLLAGHAGAQNQAAIERAEQDEAICYSMRALTLDDGKSDAGTIGRAVLTACTAQRRAYVRALSPMPMDDMTIGMVLERRREADLDMATAAVLIHRKHAAAQSKPAP